MFYVVLLATQTKNHDKQKFKYGIAQINSVCSLACSFYLFIAEFFKLFMLIKI